jgi:hypothetical protein
MARDTLKNYIITLNLRLGFFFSFPFYYLNVNMIPQTASDFTKFVLSIIILLGFTLLSFIDIVGHFLTIYILDHTKIGEIYPKLKPILNYYKKTNYYFLAFEKKFFLFLFIL